LEERELLRDAVYEDGVEIEVVVICLVEHEGVVVEGEEVAGVGAALDWFASALDEENLGKSMGKVEVRTGEDGIEG
jgi:hypothetical protein